MRQERAWNVRRPAGEQDDVIFWTVPGFIVDYTLGNYTLSAGYRAEIQNYLDLTEQNFVNHIGAVQFLAEYCEGTLEPWALPPVGTEVTVF